MEAGGSKEGEGVLRGRVVTPAPTAVEPLYPVSRLLRGEVLEAERLLAKAEEGLAESRNEAAALLRASEEQAQRVLAEAREAGEALREEARAAGRRDAAGEVQALLNQLRRQVEAARERYPRDVQRAAFRFAEAILDIEFELRPERIVELVARMIERAKQYRRVGVHLHPDDLPLVESARERLLAELGSDASLRLQSDPSLALHEVVVETEMGQYSGSIEEQLRPLREHLGLKERDERVARAAAAAAERERAAAERERAAVERERIASERERNAIERVRAAEEREHAAAEREREWAERASKEAASGAGAGVGGVTRGTNGPSSAASVSDGASSGSTRAPSGAEGGGPNEASTSRTGESGAATSAGESAALRDTLRASDAGRTSDTGRTGAAAFGAERIGPHQHPLTGTGYVRVSNPSGESGGASATSVERGSDEGEHASHIETERDAAQPADTPAHPSSASASTMRPDRSPEPDCSSDEAHSADESQSNDDSHSNDEPSSSGGAR